MNHIVDNSKFCQSYLYNLKKNTPNFSLCKTYKINKELSHCSSDCKNYFISRYKIKKNTDSLKRASFCIFYKKAFNKTYILIHKRTNSLSVFKEQFFIPGGKVEVGETYVEALKREILEETNIDITQYLDNIKVFLNVNKMMIVFGIKVDDDWGCELKKEHYEFKTDSYCWVDINEIINSNKNESYCCCYCKLDNNSCNSCNCLIVLTRMLNNIKKKQTDNDLFNN